ncbi:class F sortase, partial [Streptomyces otsuchiensis]|uniref:class F sortase n=1 Tax=Streptomyces otsuchiensis TaxID=2681388 RepID=UPI001D1310A5
RAQGGPHADPATPTNAPATPASAPAASVPQPGRRRPRVPASVRRVAAWPQPALRTLRRFPWSRFPAAARQVRGRISHSRELDRTRTRPQRLAPRSRRMEAAAVAGSVLLCLLVGAVAPTPGSQNREAQASAAGETGSAAPDGEVDGSAMDRSDPTRIRVPQIGIDVEVFGADLDPNGGPPSPAEEDAMRAAWYAGGVSPGENGSSLIVGHLDTLTGPAAFAGLGMLEPGGTIEVDREDGSTAVFTVETVEQYPKEDFPNDRVYGATEDPQLRLITCGGRWTADGGYDANIVAYARLGDGSGPPASGDAGADGGSPDADGAPDTDGAVDDGLDLPFYPFVPEGERGDAGPDAPGATGPGMFSRLGGIGSLTELDGFALPEGFGSPDGTTPNDGFPESFGGDEFGNGFTGHLDSFEGAHAPGDVLGDVFGDVFADGAGDAVSDLAPEAPPADSGEPAPGW